MVEVEGQYRIQPHRVEGVLYSLGRVSDALVHVTCEIMSRINIMYLEDGLPARSLSCSLITIAVQLGAAPSVSST